MKLIENLKEELLTHSKYSLGSCIYHYGNTIDKRYHEESRWVSGCAIIERLGKSGNKIKLADKLIKMINENLSNPEVVKLCEYSNWLIK